jgi:hypothetical protein
MNKTWRIIKIILTILGALLTGGLLLAFLPRKKVSPDAKDSDVLQEVIAEKNRLKDEQEKLAKKQTDTEIKNKWSKIVPVLIILFLVSNLWSTYIVFDVTEGVKRDYGTITNYALCQKELADVNREKVLILITMTNIQSKIIEKQDTYIKQAERDKKYVELKIAGISLTAIIIFIGGFLASKELSK